ncbi:rhodanese-like domain-containing protein [Psychroserpens burtonensis]|uniref:Rhodanese-like domain-containing protein n=1 Tax=Psychroserpens burtonensis TaxID=49278 RepID=A0A5C7B9L4_9FLAO|nr:rhodanese-like domain-containing protein [Psychroserpens burtonensis]TXE19312.1 rhodanese-like domain-containing protein [Psychroserpens burtonensis]
MKLIVFIFFGILSFSMSAQDSLDDLLKQYNHNTVPYISVQELAMPKTEAIILDAREQSEYAVSHIKDAIFVGYDHFNLEQTIQHLQDRNQAIVVYCSLGIRSETIANRLKKAGYTNVKNLYGGIFEWRNKGFKVYNSEDKKTDSIHAFSKAWSKWLTKGTKVYPETKKSNYN